MTTPSHNASFDRLIAEAFAADEAGVFASTPVDVAAILRRPAPSPAIRWYERVMVGLPIAACLAIVVGMATMFGGPTGTTPTPLAGLDSWVASAPAAGLCSMDMVAQCVTGPGRPVGAECECADLDGDGDVDLSDLGSFQRLASNM